MQAALRSDLAGTEPRHLNSLVHQLPRRGEHELGVLKLWHGATRGFDPFLSRARTFASGSRDRLRSGAWRAQPEHRNSDGA